MAQDVRIGIVGVNMGHAQEFSRLVNGEGGSGGPVGGARVTAVWGDDEGDGVLEPATASQISRREPGPSGAVARQVAADYGIATVVDHPREMIGAIDLAIIIDDTGRGASHRALASLYLEAGVATFIDKPMVRSTKDAMALFELAEKTGTALYSSSSLRFADGLAELREGVDGSWAFYAVSDGPWFYYGVHVSEMLSAAGAGRPATVRRIVLGNRDVGIVTYPSGATAILEVVRGTAFHGHRLEVRRPGGISVHDVGPTQYDPVFSRQLEAAIEMARSGHPPIGAQDTLEVIGLLELGELSAAQDGAEVAWEALGLGS